VRTWSKRFQELEDADGDELTPSRMSEYEVLLGDDAREFLDVADEDRANL